jgi:putative membrane protein
MNRLLLGAVAGAFLTLAPTVAVLAAARDDKAFIADVVATNMEEIQLGQLAQQKSQNADVKAYGAKLVADHTMNNMQATAIAMKLSVTLPTTLSASAKMTYDTLSAMSGTAFDQMFLTHMVMGHQMAIQMFMDQSASTNMDVVTFAKMSLPTLQAHLATAQMLQKAGA